MTFLILLLILIILPITAILLGFLTKRLMMKIFPVIAGDKTFLVGVFIFTNSLLVWWLRKIGFLHIPYVSVLLFIFVMSIYFHYEISSYYNRRREINNFVLTVMGMTGNSNFKVKWFELKPLVNAEVSLKRWCIEKYRLVKEENIQEKCSVCDKGAVFKNFERINNSPLLYNYLRSHDIMGRQLLPGEFEKRNLSVNDKFLPGRYSMMYFCSDNCHASYVLWKYFIPINEEQRRRLKRLKAEIKIKKYFSKIREKIFNILFPSILN